MSLGTGLPSATPASAPGSEREFFIDNLLFRIHFIIVMIRWTGLAPWEFAFPLPGSLTSTFLEPGSSAAEREATPRIILKIFVLKMAQVKARIRP